MAPMSAPNPERIQPRHRKLIEDAAASLIAVADDVAIDLITLIAEMERYIVEETKVGNAARDPQVQADIREYGRYGYTLNEKGRLVRVEVPLAGIGASL